jgi:L-alanine-DL-glutamate epimerase-like enolase superfamily enzyme
VFFAGLGECADGDRAADVLAMRDRLIGLDVREITIAERRCLPGFRYSPWSNVQGLRRVFGGIEVATWDARAKTDGELLGPFGLDASRPDFWRMGISVIEGLIDELAELDEKV